MSPQIRHIALSQQKHPNKRPIICQPAIDLKPRPLVSCEARSTATFIHNGHTLEAPVTDGGLPPGREGIIVGGENTEQETMWRS
jgi:hypothetical protein